MADVLLSSSSLSKLKVVAVVAVVDVFAGYIGALT